MRWYLICAAYLCLTSGANGQAADTITLHERVVEIDREVAVLVRALEALVCAVEHGLVLRRVEDRVVEPTVEVLVERLHVGHAEPAEPGAEVHRRDEVGVGEVEASDTAHRDDVHVVHQRLQAHFTPASGKNR